MRNFARRAAASRERPPAAAGRPLAFTGELPGGRRTPEQPASRNGLHPPGPLPLTFRAAPRSPRSAVPELDRASPPELLDEVREGDAAVGLDRDAPALRDVRLRERTYRRSLVGADAVTAGVAMILAINVIGGYRLRPLGLLVVPLIVLAAKISGLYDKDELVVEHSPRNELPRLLNLATVLALLVWLARHYLIAGAPMTSDLLALWGLLTAGLVIGRTGARALSRRVAPVERCLLVGRTSVFERLDEKLREYSRVTLAGVVNAADVAHDHAKLREVAERLQVHRIVIDTDETTASTTLEIIRAANATSLQVSLLPTMLGAVGSSVVFDDIGGLMLMGVPRFGLGRSSLALKRIFDVAGAGIGLVCVGPLMLVLAVAIRLDTPGPVLFRQTRVGRDGTPFVMFKFRSMVDGADALKDSLRARNESDGLFKIRADPRITRVGRVLRRTGLDELTQLLNVLAGDMSLVGPRPLVVEEDTRVTGFDRRRLHLTPGITGRWQTLGSARVPLSEMVKIDYLYITNWSLWLDVKIILETIGFLARGRGL